MSDECLITLETAFSFYTQYQAVMRKFTLAGKLTAQNRVLVRNLCHALGVFLRNHTHPVAKATVKNQCFHTYN